MIKNSKQAKLEAIRRKIEQGGLNFDETMELAYSPSTFAVGCRQDKEGSFLVFNTEYPMYGKSEEVTDWVSVGVAKSK